MRNNSELTWITCSGIVDADDYGGEDKSHLADLSIETLPVAEIENLILLPDVSRAIAESEGYQGQELEDKLTQLSASIFETVDTAEKIELVAVRYCRRRIDRILKKIDLGAAKTVAEIGSEYKSRTGALDVKSIARQLTEKINTAIASQDLPKLLAHYDNKGLMSLASSILKGSQMSVFESWLTRALRNETAPNLVAAISAHLPKLTPAKSHLRVKLMPSPPIACRSGPFRLLRSDCKCSPLSP